MIQVASYCRVSTEKEDQSNSFETQKRYFKEYISNQPDWKLYEIYADEGITGTSTRKRTQFRRMMNDAYEGKFRMIITKEVSRFSRNILDTISYTRELRALGIGVIFLNDRINTLDPEAEMLLSFLSSLAQEESRRTSSRVVWGQTRQMERGVVFGRSMLGYDVENGVLSLNPEGAEIVRLIFQKYGKEQMSTSQIARYLTEQKIPTYYGSIKWKANAVIKILNNEKYVGDLIQKKTYTPDFLTHEKKSNKDAVPKIIIENHHEPIISREIWEMTQARLKQNHKHNGAQNGHSNRYIFSGKIKCGQCGSSFVGRFQYLKDGTKIRRWSCGTATAEGAAGCDIGKLIRDDDALEMLKTAITRLPMDTETIIQKVAIIVLESILEEVSGGNDEPDRLEQEIQSQWKRKEAVMDSYFSGEISKEEMQRMKEKYDLKIEEFTTRKAQAQLRQRENRDAKSLRREIENALRDILKGETESEVFYKSMVKSLTVFKDRHVELQLNHLPHIFRFEE